MCPRGRDPGDRSGLAAWSAQRTTGDETPFKKETNPQEGLSTQGLRSRTTLDHHDPARAGGQGAESLGWGGARVGTASDLISNWVDDYLIGEEGQRRARRGCQHSRRRTSPWGS